MKFILRLNYSNFPDNVGVHVQQRTISVCIWCTGGLERGFGNQKMAAYAYLVESTTNKYYNQKKPCKTMAVQERLSSSSYGIAVSKSLKGLTKDLTLAILELREKAKIKVFENKWWSEKGNVTMTMRVLMR
ncbi:putative glutamate receptor 2-like [Apostichopus japonicus]|uniref:Putative glutamate receptor 2-like n=1 Tax=Stichopus japonicus TaxID=307972 RepID=A0A2G8LKD1_STIJA|nr:putative glutamate receptor 2-like [Apostichopus japonicus]